MFSLSPTPFDVTLGAFGIPVRVHGTFWIAAALLSYGIANGNLALLILCMLAVFLSILVHELGHALLIRKYGSPTEIVLYFGGGWATRYRALSAWRSILVSFAGPLAGLALGGLSFASLLILDGWRGSLDPRLAQPLLTTLYFLVWINVVWSIFNLIPIYPMDGGQIARTFLMWLRPMQGLRWSLILSMLSAALIFALALYSHSPFAAMWVAMFGYQNFQEFRSLRSPGRWNYR